MGLSAGAEDPRYTTKLMPCACRTRISELTLHRWFIGTTWGMLAVILGLLALLYNLYPDRGLESWEKRWALRPGLAVWLQTSGHLLLCPDNN
jgi:hypothetical protein